MSRDVNLVPDISYIGTSNLEGRFSPVDIALYHMLKQTRPAKPTEKESKVELWL